MGKARFVIVLESSGSLTVVRLLQVHQKQTKALASLHAALAEGEGEVFAIITHGGLASFVAFEVGEEHGDLVDQFRFGLALRLQFFRDFLSAQVPVRGREVLRDSTPFS